MKKTYFLIIPFLSLLVSCEDMVSTVDVPQSESHYVLHAYISPEDTTVNVTVSKSHPVFGDQEEDSSWVAQTRVFINNHELTRVPNTNYRYTTPVGSFSVIAGESYTVTLMVGSEKVCSGSCVVPLIRNESLVFDGLDSVQYEEFDGYSHYNYSALYSFTDFGSEGDFYRISAEIDWYDSLSTITTHYSIFSIEHLIRDLLFNGEVYSGCFKLGYFEMKNVTGLKLVLYTTDNNYFFYHRAIMSQNGDDPFSEPVIVPTNVENGIGCVAGYRKFTLTIF